MDRLFAWLLMLVMGIFLTACPTQPAAPPVPVSPQIVSIAYGAGSAACILVPAADRPTGIIVLEDIRATLFVNPSAALSKLELQAKTNAAVAFVWMAIQSAGVLGSIQTSAQWVAAYEPAAAGAVAGCLNTLSAGGGGLA